MSVKCQLGVGLVSVQGVRIVSIRGIIHRLNTAYWFLMPAVLLKSHVRFEALGGFMGVSEVVHAEWRRQASAHPSFRVRGSRALSQGQLWSRCGRRNRVW